MHDLTEDEFRDRLEQLFDPLVVRPISDDASELDLGATNDDLEAEFLAMLNDLDNLQPPPRPLYTEADYEAIRADLEILRDEPAYISRYDRLFRARNEIEKNLAELDQDHPEYHSEMARLADLNVRIRTALKRAQDDHFREYERIDEWRLTHKEEYNASRRVRKRPNKMTPKDVLASETSEQKKERLRQRDRELKAEKRARMRAQCREAGSKGST